MVFTATAAILLDGEGFNRLVAEEDLRVWEQDGYIYTKRRGKDGIEIYRTYGPKWKFIYQCRRVATNTNAAGGAIVIDITCPADTTMRVLRARGSQATAGVHVVAMTVVDEDNNLVSYLGVGGAAAAASNISIPAIGATPTASDLTVSSTDLLVGPGEKLSIYTTGASAQANDTCTAHVVLLLPTRTEPTWSVARSTNVAQTSLAASTISSANEWQAVLIP